MRLSVVRSPARQDRQYAYQPTRGRSRASGPHSLHRCWDPFRDRTKRRSRRHRRAHRSRRSCRTSALTLVVTTQHRTGCIDYTHPHTVRALIRHRQWATPRSDSPLVGPSPDSPRRDPVAPRDEEGNDSDFESDGDCCGGVGFSSLMPGQQSCHASEKDGPEGGSHYR